MSGAQRVPPEAAGAPAAAASSEADLAFLKLLSETRGFTNGRPQSIQLTPDGATALFLRAQPRKPELSLWAWDLATATERELASAASVLGGPAGELSAEEKARRERMRISSAGIVGYELSRDGALALFTFGGRGWVVPVAGGPAREVARRGPKGEPVFDAHLSPDGQHAGFIRGGELWVAPVAGGAERQLTSGAGEGVLHAQAEFVAQEELSRFRGWWWSPDSLELLWEEVDNRGVEQLWLQDPARMFRPVTPIAYPRPGRSNASFRFGLVPREGGATRWIDHRPAEWEYVSRVFWEAGHPPVFAALTRDQRQLALLEAAPDGGVRELLRERDEPFLNPERDLRWLASGGFLWTSEVGGAWQLWLHDPAGKPVRALNAPEQRFVRLAGLDEKAGLAFALCAPTPVRRELWAFPLAGGAGFRVDPPGGAEGAVDAVFARGAQARVVTVSSPHGPPRWFAVRASGQPAGELRSVAEAAPLDPRVEIAQVGAAPEVAGGKPAADGGFWTALVRPRDFDPARRYPVILQVYGGPHALHVHGPASAYLSDQWIADHGFLVARADNRGTPLRGRDWERAIAGRFSEVPLDDQVAALQALAAREPAMDLGRVGVIGHSFGGFVAALAVLKRPDVFRAAVAGAPVVEWLDYDTAYTERYLGVPPPAGKTDVYARNALTPLAPQLQRPLLLVHGTADDNVHFSQTLLLADALFRAGRPFELLPQVGQTHMFAQPELQVRYWERVFGFFREHL